MLVSFSSNFVTQSRMYSLVTIIDLILMLISLSFLCFVCFQFFLCLTAYAHVAALDMGCQCVQKHVRGIATAAANAPYTLALA